MFFNHLTKFIALFQCDIIIIFYVIYPIFIRRTAIADITVIRWCVFDNIIKYLRCRLNFCLYPTVYKNLRKSMIFISCFNLSLLFSTFTFL